MCMFALLSIVEGRLRKRNTFSKWFAIVSLKNGEASSHTSHSKFNSTSQFSDILCTAGFKRKRKMYSTKERVRIELGGGSEVEYFPQFFPHKESFEWMTYLDQHIPWTRPSLHIFGRICSQPRETCYIAKDGLPVYKYSGYEPEIHSWDDYPPIKNMLKAVHEALPGTTFNSLLLNRYKHGSDYVGWHSDNEPLYGPTPTIASVTLGTEREFLMRRKKTKMSRGEGINALNKSIHNTEKINTNASELKLVKARPNLISVGSEPSSSAKRDYDSALSVSTNIFDKLKAGQRVVQSKHSEDHYSFMLKHGSLFAMKGYTQRDWEHSVPKRMKIQGLRINLTFRYVLES